ncbi:MAG: DUF1963 domain-containing protein [Sulfitobacter sp.]
MRLFKKLLGSLVGEASEGKAQTGVDGLQRDWRDLIPQEDIDQMLKDAPIPGVLMVKQDAAKHTVAPGCWFGGKPTLPAEIDWPCYEEYERKLQIPMHFLFQLNLAELPRTSKTSALPDSGTLFVFLDPVFAALSPYDCFALGRGISVIHWPEDVSDVRGRSAPVMPDLSDLEVDAVTSHDWAETSAQDRSPEFPQIAFGLSELNTFKGLGAHIPFEIKGMLDELWAKEATDIAQQYGCEASDLNLPVECHSILGASQRREPPIFQSMPGLEREDFVLLFSLGPDPALGLDFFDGYGMGIWMPRQDLEEMRFDRCVVHPEHFA